METENRVYVDYFYVRDKLRFEALIKYAKPLINYPRSGRSWTVSTG